MKCVCGYDDENKEKLIKIEPVIFWHMKEYDYERPDEIRIKLYACPKCGTVKMEVI